jgi:hypothetical protein
MKDLSTTIIDHVKKMISVAKIKCNEREKDRNEREKDRSYAMQAEICASLRSLGAEKRQMMIQMQAEKVRKNKTRESYPWNFLKMMTNIHECGWHWNSMHIAILQCHISLLSINNILRVNL